MIAKHDVIVQFVPRYSDDETFFIRIASSKDDPTATAESLVARLQKACGSDYKVTSKVITPSRFTP